jgi:tight adherence protein B
MPTTDYVRLPVAPEALEPPELPFPWIWAVVVFGSLMAIILLVWPRRRVSRARLGIRQPKRVSELGQRTLSMLEEIGRRGDLATHLSVADIGTKPGEFLALVAAAALVVGCVGLFLGGPLLAVALATAVCWGVRFYVRHKKAKRQQAFADQLPDVLQLVTTALRSGYGIMQALDAVAEETEEPARSEFAHVLVESRLGRDLSESMRALAERMASVDMEWVVGALDINRDTGSNLSEVLGQVSITIRERQGMAREVRTLTAEGRLSARILTAMPFVMALWQWRVNPSFGTLFHGAGLTALAVAGALMLVGWLWIRHIVNSVAL